MARRFSLIGVVLLALLLAGSVGLHLYHRTMFDLAGLETAVDDRIERIREIEAAGPSPGVRDPSWLPENTHNGRVLRLDERLEEARVSPLPRAAANPPDAGLPTFAYHDDERPALLPLHGNYMLDDGVLSMDVRNGDYLITRGDLEIPASEVAEVEIRIRLERGARFRLGWSSSRLDALEGPGRREVGFLDVHVFGDGRFHVYRIDLASALRYKLDPDESIRTLILEPSDTAGDRVEIDYVRLVPKGRRFRQQPVGRAYHTISGEMRQSVHTTTPRELRWRIRIPEEDPRLDVGMGVLEKGNPVDFEVRVDEGTRSTRILARHVDGPVRWHDARADLSRWAGRSVELALSTDGGDSNVAFWTNPRVSGRPARPLHVILVLEDTLRADHLSLYGHELETSPTKDRLARHGVVFEHAFSQATKTRPSCPSLMTSLYPTATGVWNFHEMLHDGYLTLAEILRSQGFETASFVQNTNGGAAAGLHQGFSYLWGPGTMGSRPEEIYGQKALDWIEERGDRNLFVYLHGLDPHSPYDPPPPYDAWYRREPPGPKEVERRPEKYDPEWVDRATVEGRRLLYDGEIRNSDERFGAFLEALDRRGLLEDALLVFVSDHGEHLGEHGLWAHRPPSLRQVIHVPLLMVYPDRLPAGVRVPGPVELVDVAPTILDLADVPLDGLPFQGRSLVPRLREDPSRETRLAVSEEVMAYRGKTDPSVRASFLFGRWHLLRSSRGEGPVELQAFDYLRDPEEKRPLASLTLDPLMRRRIGGAMRRLKEANMAHWRSMATKEEDAIDIDPKAWEQLEALGYVE